MNLDELIDRSIQSIDKNSDSLSYINDLNLSTDEFIESEKNKIKSINAKNIDITDRLKKIINLLDSMELTLKYRLEKYNEKNIDIQTRSTETMNLFHLICQNLISE